MNKTKIVVESTITENVEKVWDYYTNPEQSLIGMLLTKIGIAVKPRMIYVPAAK